MNPIKSKAEFLEWLDQFSRFPPSLRSMIERRKFGIDELERMRPQIIAKYRVKVEYLRRRAGS